MAMNGPQTVTAMFHFFEQAVDLRMIDRSAVAVRHQILLADIGNIGRIVIFGEQMVKRLLLGRADRFRDRFIPFFAIGKDGVNIEHNAAEIEQTMAHHIARRKDRTVDDYR